MFKAKAIYLKWTIRFQGVRKWLFPKNLKIKMKRDPRFPMDSIYAISVIIRFTLNKRGFWVILPSSIHFENIREISEAFLKAYERAIKRIERRK